MTGDGNELWADFLQRNVVALGYDKSYFDAWNAGDRDEFLQLEMKAAQKAATESDVWMNAPWEEAKVLARSAPNEAIMVTSREAYGSSIISKDGEPLQANLL